MTERGDYQPLDRLVAERLSGWVEELREFCAIPSEAGDPATLGAAAAWTADRLRAAGATVASLQLDGVPPLVVGEVGAAARTLICVQHYDVQPAVPLELWTTPPYEPHVRDGRLYARGAADNKGEFLLRVWALEAYRDLFGDPSCRVRFLVEGEEESGSANHSSVSMLLPNAAIRLVAALATLWDADGLPTFTGWRDAAISPTADDRTLIASIPTEELDAMARVYGVDRFLRGREKASALEALAFEPTCNLQGLWAGYTGPGGKTVTPAEAHARLDIRLIPDQEPDRMEAALRAHLDAHGFGDIEMTRDEEAERPYWSPIHHPIVDAAARASEAVFGVPAIRVLPAPGTAPMFQVCGRHRLPMVSIGASDAEARAHAPNESESLELMGKGVRAMAGFLDEFAAMNG